MTTMAHLPSSPPRGPRQSLAVVIVLLVGVLAYFYGLFGGFLFDDFGAIVDNPAVRNVDGSFPHWIAVAFSSDSGILRRPLSMLSFGLDHYLFGLSPLAFKLTNLAVHLLNGLLLYALAKRLIPRLSPLAGEPRLIALVVMAFWLLHPLNVDGVVYVVQRMNLLAVLFMLLGLLCYANGRERMLRGESGGVLAFGGLFLFGLLAVFSKENGALITAFALVIEAVCYRFEARAPLQRKGLQGFFVASVALPALAFLVYIAVRPSWIEHAYAGRDFTLIERLLTEPRILCDYLLWIVLPLPRWMGIYHDDIVTSTGLFSPATTIVAIAFLTALVIAAWRTRRSHPGFTFAVAWFLIGHSMESTIIPLELVFDHRNYMPMAGLILGVVCAVSPWVRTHLPVRAAAAGTVAIVVALAATTAAWAYTWGDPLRLALTQARDHPRSARAQYEAGRQIVFHGSADGHREAAEREAVPYFERGKELDPTDVYSTSSLIIIKGRNGGTVDAADVADLAGRIRTELQPNINPFLVVLTAATDGSITLTPDEMKLLVTSALDNPRFPPTMRAMILNDYGHYMFSILHDPQQAISLTLAAAAQDPGNPLFQINLTKIALEIGALDKASEHLAIAETLNKVGYYDKVIAELKSRVAALH